MTPANGPRHLIDLLRARDSDFRGGDEPAVECKNDAGHFPPRGSKVRASQNGRVLLKEAVFFSVRVWVKLVVEIRPGVKPQTARIAG
jgi:hypothetical protein